MQSRIDTLGDSVEYLDKLTGNVLSFEADPILQELAAQAAEMLKTPMALVSLVLRRTQHFRASYGLPPELEATKATDRATSFCQLVVRDEMPVLVSNAATDERIPQDLVHRYGLESYVGVPVTIGDTVVGSMCGLDVVQRAFTPQDVAKLRVIAKRASSRLTELASEQRPSFELLGKAADPAFSDIRNALVVLVTAPGFVSTAVTELESLAALTKADLSDEARLRALGALPDIASTLQDLREAAHELNKAAKRVHKGVQGMESLLALRPDTNLTSCIISAGRLADHHIKLLGGVEWAHLPPMLQVLAPSAIVVAILTASLSELSLGKHPRGAGPIRMSTTQSSGAFCMRFDVVGGSELAASTAVANVNELLDDAFGLVISADKTSVNLQFALV
tara:strand:- start:42560 stop:43738 length:1179 start_codon:yes stop_codon:yes gene_type:complete